ncbi:YqjF family protein [Cellulomonas fimi]|uniref:DUF2071 domain-containing protein n=1 Tax=Cellulomonas fimi (strain ATCC 484 / DSM 20113 / JCM 1341 / CCUG 24087 / LMG 16345 / NBRC 15513 / NCIMB 8980 / NCTC 7547 / NRS-133) TaxID=590998 RepID=F4H0X0_CELFA|nr:DUF2071 domain-containing protein [Cellulomonas fimi]AEE46217.1 hypothetical protein Celf_2089 [Cellulomonas fimi ATCC 484]NNH08586.1 DUF2071 domain-containing protein [Cellulomonas fimi]VEH32100.1 Uncharacterized conserved protein [Cellulomonas fimi]
MSGRSPDAPVRAPASYQRWDGITFLHWPYPPAVVGALLPPGLVVDVLDGAAWVGLTPFAMRDVRVPGLPALPRWSQFLEVNVRTYVRHPASGTDGLWFLTLLCPRRAFVAAMRVLGLPYVHAAGAVVRTTGAVEYAAATDRGRRLRVVVEPGDAVRFPDAWSDAVTGRWNAFTRRAGTLWRVPVEHAPWPLHDAAAPRLRTDLLEACGLPTPSGAPRVSWSPGVDVRVGAPRPVALVHVPHRRGRAAAVGPGG